MKSCLSCTSSAFVYLKLPRSNFKDECDRVIYKCPNCSLLFKDVATVQEGLSEYYLNNDNTYSFKVKKKAKSVYFLKNEVLKLSNGGTLLDIGCNDGFFLSLFGTDYSTFGVEPSKVKFCSSSITRYTGFFENLNFEKNKFSIVTAFDVIEHVFNVNVFFSKLNNITEQGSYILLTTPATSSLTARFFGRYWRHFLPREHIIFYDDKSIVYLAEKYNFKLIKVKLYDHKRDGLISFFLLLRSILTFTIKFVTNLFKTKKKKLFFDMFMDYKLYVLVRN
jgi:SAM-dependent methyltransferase